MPVMRHPRTGLPPLGRAEEQLLAGPGSLSMDRCNLSTDDAATNDEKGDVEDYKHQVDEDDASADPLELNIEKAEYLGIGETDRTEFQVL